ncbi:DszA family xenobiotic compound monooxygenase [Cucurbitaria berberidis CBS 394.84]|uniref:DszA family xenobiotic compound monooxygenase n=1 Tax=Cucurbitaria berberidis CBS 394.84 TaxID=1168544 RepID=A0A9P4GV91_9PLEO|nr:DszA family xenobiotic compound monooxygenase [Cucurbitaria berberidis CBS 394.84]KAF1851995.1 DszA family xenobiotic compound monooxygenase [Cucurbitaria berberidis CBS 394.84]
MPANATRANGVRKPKKKLLLNAFDMFTPSHLAFGQWANPRDRSKDKRRDLSYWTDLAKILEKGSFVGYFLADTYGPYDVLEGSAAPAIRTGAQFPMADPIIPISAMASVTKHLNFAATTSTSYEQPYVVAKRFTTLDHLTGGRFGWNIVTSWKPAASKAVGLPYVEHDQRYENADEYLRILYKLWEGSWADDALKEDAERRIYTDPARIRTIKHSGKWTVDAPFIVDPSPQRTPVLFQAGTSAAGMKFGSTHAEAIFVSGLSPHVVAPRVKAIREGAVAAGRDPQSVKIFAMITPIIGKDEEDADRKHREALQYASEEGGLAQWCAATGVDVSQFDLDHLLTEQDVPVGQWQRLQQSSTYNLRYSGTDIPPLTVRNLGKLVAIGGTGAMPKGSPSQVADIFEQWVDIADVDGFNIAYVVSPGSFEDVSTLLAPELRRRGLLDEPIKEGAPVLTYRERIYGKGQKGLRSDHPGFKYKYETYEQTVAEEEALKNGNTNEAGGRKRRKVRR